MEQDRFIMGIAYIKLTVIHDNVVVPDGPYIIPIDQAALVNLYKLFWVQLLSKLFDCVIGMITEGSCVYVQKVSIFFQIQNILCENVKGLSISLY